MKEQFDVQGMTCAACQANVTKAVSKLDGVDSCEVYLLSNSMKVEYDDEKVDASMISQAVSDAGYSANIKGESVPKASDSYQKESDESFGRLMISIGLLIPLMIVAMGPMVGLPILSGSSNAMISALTQVLLSLAILICEKHFFVHGFKALYKKAPNMDSLVAIGSTAAFVYGLYGVYRMAYGFGYGHMDVVHHSMHSLYFESAAMIVTLVSVGKYLEARSKAKTSDALSKLMDLAPKSATVLRGGKEIVVPIEQVVLKDVIVIRPGQRIPVDGTVIAGHGYVDQSAITGESIPVEKGIGDVVLSATSNQNGSFQFEATSVGNDTTLSKIIALVEEAGNSKAPIARLADRVSGVFVPIVIGIAIVTAIVWIALGQSFEFALSAAISVLVISCPCALGLATPVAIMVGTGKAASLGILIKSAASLETLHATDTIVLDKTGTITEGKPSVQDVISTSDLSNNELLALAASMEVGSEHPLGQAIVEKAKEMNLDLFDVSSFMAATGKGIEAVISDTKYFAGNVKYMESLGIDVDRVIIDSLSAQGKTPMVFATKDQALGVIAVADTIRDTSIQAIRLLKDQGLHVIMLTGDNHTTAKAIGQRVGVDEVISDVLPTDKEQVISRLQSEGKKVVMVGDGINDAPALVRADVGIAIGKGTDIAIDSADVVLMKNSLIDVSTAIDLSRSVIRNIKMNLFWAFFYNACGIPLAAGVFYPFFGWLLSPMIGSAAMSLSSVCVVTNALRLRGFKPKYEAVISKKEETKMNKVEIKVEGMMCQHCVAHVKKALEQVAGVSSVEVSLENKNAIVTSENELNVDTLKQAIVDAGYQAA